MPVDDSRVGGRQRLPCFFDASRGLKGPAFNLYRFLWRSIRRLTKGVRRQGRAEANAKNCTKRHTLHDRSPIILLEQSKLRPVSPGINVKRFTGDENLILTLSFVNRFYRLT